MNAAQYKIVKTMTSLPLFDTRKFAAMIKVDHAEVLRVQSSASYEQYKNNDTPLEDLMSKFMGGL